MSDIPDTIAVISDWAIGEAQEVLFNDRCYEPEYVRALPQQFEATLVLAKALDALMIATTGLQLITVFGEEDSRVMARGALNDIKSLAIDFFKDEEASS